MQCQMPVTSTDVGIGGVDSHSCAKNGGASKANSALRKASALWWSKLEDFSGEFIVTGRGANNT